MLNLLPTLALANDNGLAKLPPMGWRSWNLYGGNVDQTKIETIMEGMVRRDPRYTVDGEPTSLCDLGYCDVGLDDNWQECGSYGSEGYKYHTEDGSPVINTDRFPSMKAMTDKAHSLGLYAGWYGNNCICSDGKTGDRKFYEGDTKALREFGFDSWKLDGCGAQVDMQLWDDVIKATPPTSGRKAIMVENCHWGSRVPFKPNATWCPWNFYRTSGDVRANYGSIVGNLQSTITYAQQNLSYPGCWAYPDMLAAPHRSRETIVAPSLPIHLNAKRAGSAPQRRVWQRLRRRRVSDAVRAAQEVGVLHTPFGGDKGLTIEETRAHFGSWAIVSSPLTLSHDVNNKTIQDAIWPIIANKEVIAVSQSYAGYSGSPFKASAELLKLSDVNWAEVSPAADLDEVGPLLAPAWQYFYKPMLPGGAKTAVLLMNHAGAAADLTLSFADIPGVTCTTCKLRDIWSHKDLGTFDGSYTAKAVASHDAAFLIVTPATVASPA